MTYKKIGQPLSNGQSRSFTGRELSILEDIDSISAEVTVDFAITTDAPTGIELTQKPTRDVSKLLETIKRRQTSPEAIALREANKEYGHIAKSNREVDAWRAGPGKEEANAKARERYYLGKLAATGEPPRAYEVATPERRKEQKRASKKSKLASMSPDQLDAYRKSENQNRQRRREAAKQLKREEAAAKLAARTIF